MALYLDTETTGLSPRNGDAIVEVSIVDEHGRVVIDSLVNPQRAIPWPASRVHGITDDMVAGQPTLAQLMPTIRQAIRGQQVVIYNSTFDAPFFPGMLGEAASVECAMRRFAAKVGGGSWKKLDVAAAHVGHVWSGKAHRALADALACRSVWRWLESGSPSTPSQQRSTSASHPEAGASRIIGCGNCHQRLRVPSGRLLDVTCPTCRHTFRITG